MLKQIVLAVVVALGLSGRAGAQEIYQWRDAGGNVHFSNAPTHDSAPTGLTPEPSAPAATGEEGTAAAAEGEAAPAEPADNPDAAYSTEASSRRSGLEHQLRDAERHVRDIDSKLIALAHARTRNAQGSAATGGVGTSAADAQSDEERNLAAEREREQKHVDELRGNYGSSARRWP